ncbi:MAG: NAD(P)-dependent alcohol dehydrogenase [Kangiellaceae bacterium]|nr:NAD(P)-dependent alcohol dehydrogenase [Kangiellaceae bacterium]
MKAIVYKEYGSPDVLTVEEVSKPSPKSNQILVKVCAAEATKSDCEMRSFNFSVNWFWLPLRLAVGIFRPRRRILGGYFSGIVEEVGSQVTRFKAGDEVFGSTGLSFGAYGEFMCVDHNATLSKKPAGISFEEAAATPLGGLNALHFMRLADIKQGQKVLINGAGGSIGSFALQIAKNMGAEVTAVDIGFKGGMLQEIGADHFVDYTQEEFSNLKEEFDVVFDMVANSSLDNCLAILKPGGKYLTANPSFSKMIRSIWVPKLTQKDVIFRFAKESQEELDCLAEMLTKKRISPAIDEIFSMEEASIAHRKVEAEKRVGISVISVAG